MAPQFVQPDDAAAEELGRSEEDEGLLKSDNDEDKLTLEGRANDERLLELDHEDVATARLDDAVLEDDGSSAQEDAVVDEDGVLGAPQLSSSVASLTGVTLTSSRWSMFDCEPLHVIPRRRVAEQDPDLKVPVPVVKVLVENSCQPCAMAGETEGSISRR